MTFLKENKYEILIIKNEYEVSIIYLIKLVMSLYLCVWSLMET